MRLTVFLVRELIPHLMIALCCMLVGVSWRGGMVPFCSLPEQMQRKDVKSSFVNSSQLSWGVKSTIGGVEDD
jgi:hypothetical protein